MKDITEFEDPEPEDESICEDCGATCLINEKYCYECKTERKFRYQDGVGRKEYDV